MSDTDCIQTVEGFVKTCEEFTYPQEYFLQRINEEIYHCNRKNQCFLWFEIPLKKNVYNGFQLQVPSKRAVKESKILEAWKLLVQMILSKEYMGIVGQGKECLWSLYTNKDLQFLESIEADIKEKLKEFGLLEYIPSNFNVYFYSGKSQSFIQEENRFIKKRNSKSNILEVKRISVENVKEKTFYGIYTRFLKRFIDISGGLFGIALFSLIMFICAIFVKRALLKWESEQRNLGKEIKKSSVLFKQIRVGRNGKLFKCYKFRNMYPGADREKEELRKQQYTENGNVSRGPTFKMENDPRVLKYGGAFLRKHSLDELPQFFNVFLGNMSIVGPRPHMLQHTYEYSPKVDKYMVRHFVKPGITGLAQSRGYRGETKEIELMEKRIKSDIEYVENWSFLLDLKIMLKTVKLILKGDNKAY